MVKMREGRRGGVEQRRERAAQALAVLVLALGILNAPTASAQSTDTTASDAPEMTSTAPAITPEADTESRRHYRVGLAHYQNGDFTEAAAEFEQAYSYAPHPELLYNLYLAYRDAGDVEGAARSLRGYLERSEHPDQEETLRGRLATLDRQVAELHARDASTPTPTPTPTPAATSGSAIASSPVGFIVGGVGLAAILGAVVVAVVADQTRASLESRCGPARDACPAGFESDRDTGQALSITADVLGIGGGVVLGVGIALVFAIDGREPPPVSASCGPTGCMAVLGGRF